MKLWIFTFLNILPVMMFVVLIGEVKASDHYPPYGLQSAQKTAVEYSSSDKQTRRVKALDTHEYYADRRLQAEEKYGKTEDLYIKTTSK
jgi:hypothetical protein